MSRISIVVLVVFLALNQVIKADKKLFVTVLYESKCPDSRDFISKQLYPTVKLLQNYVFVDLVPFGKADQVGHGFKCQHGPTECAGNLVQSCALDIMRGHSDVDKVAYVNCEMTTQAGTNGDLSCVHQAGLQVDLVQSCIKSERGFGLQLEAEYKTKSFEHKFIPTVVVNGVFNQSIQDLAQRNLKAALCSKLPNAPPCA